MQKMPISHYQVNHMTTSKINLTLILIMSMTWSRSIRTRRLRLRGTLTQEVDVGSVRAPAKSQITLICTS